MIISANSEPFLYKFEILLNATIAELNNTKITNWIELVSINYETNIDSKQLNVRQLLSQLLADNQSKQKNIAQ